MLNNLDREEAKSVGVNLTDLPPKYQAQAMRKYMEQQARREIAPSDVAAQDHGTVRKYRNTPTTRVTASGNILHFDSMKEARRYDYLIERERRGEIRDLRLQVDFTLQEAYTDTEGRRVRAIRYRADFAYKERSEEAEITAESTGWPCESWHYVVEDAKSRATKTQKYAIKKKMLKDRLGLDIIEV